MSGAGCLCRRPMSEPAATHKHTPSHLLFCTLFPLQTPFASHTDMVQDRVYLVGKGLDVLGHLVAAKPASVPASA
eukprot:1372888-Rhodomonas_salina.1